ncbi:VC0807 family protein [Amycolatopsis sp.]|uniref:VC0807 family protein n=1 Tax=Amycolatopsis sp. TaxID=37632 RepID=UPI002CF8AC08|nr:VC0807 family protein [Amycolatopsis sp.]HVV07787.1 VC0807 family protein [Amycolatopsis sp.]
MPSPKQVLPSRLGPGIVLNAALPLLAYLLLRPHVTNDFTALAIGAAIPAVITLAEFAIRRRIDPVGVVMTIAFAVALIVAALSGGSQVVIETHDAVITGPLGALLLLSVLVRRPLLLVVSRFLARRKGIPVRLDPHAAAVLTALAGTVAVVHSALLLVLALSLPVTTFLAIGRPIGWVVLGLGAATLLWYRSRIKLTTA